MRVLCKDNTDDLTLVRLICAFLRGSDMAALLPHLASLHTGDELYKMCDARI